jgi:hypothetical protein
MDSRDHGLVPALLRAAALPALAVVVLVLTAPWGDYPLNDDWQYARVAKRFAETGTFLVDVPVAPSLVVQSLVSAPLVRALGFSHVSLRLLTFAFSLLSLWALGRLLELAEVSRGVRFLAQALLLLNPLFLNVSLSFMTEVYGLAPALLGATVWFSERRRSVSGGGAGGLPLRPRAVAVAAFLVALGFWSRQHVAVVFPALVGSLLLERWRLRGSPAPHRRLVAGLAPGVLLFLALLAVHPIWARATGNLRTEFSGPFEHLLRWNPVAWFFGLGAQPFYQTAFLLPLLLLVPWSGLPRARGALGAALLLGAAGFGAAGFASLPVPDFVTFVYQHRVFPFLPNVLFNAGVGPVTLSEVFHDGLPPAQLGRSLWIVVEVLLGLGSVLWVPVLLRKRPSTPSTGSVPAEVFWFGLLWAAGTLVLVLQAHQVQVFDRYLVPVTAGLLVAVAVLARVASAGRLLLAALALLPVAWFTLAGVHDYFRWNDARWDAVRSLLADGVSPTVVQGGYEVNGWLVFDDYVARREPTGCIGPCACSVERPDWNCLDDSYRIAMYPLPGYETIESRTVRTWLADSPPILTLRRVTASDTAAAPDPASGSY